MNDNRNTPESSPRTVQRSGTTSHGSVPAGLVSESHPPKRRRGGWGRAGVFTAVACLAWLAWPTAAFAVTDVTVNTVADDDIVNINEKADPAGIVINGTITDATAAANLTVTVTVGGTSLTPTVTAGTWSVTVPANSTYIVEGNLRVVVNVNDSGDSTSASATRNFSADLTAPTVSYTAPLSLTVGDAIESIDPTTSDTDIVSYAISGVSLLRGLSLNGMTGVISGMPTTGNPNTQTVEVLATDDAGNTGTAMIDFPPVAGPEPGVTVDPPAEDLPPEGLSVPEGGSVQYTLVLDTEPTHEVTIQVRLATGDDDLTAAPTTLTFTNSNWNTEQTVTVSAAEDDDGYHGIATFRHNAVSADSSYNGIGTPGVKATEADNDSIGVKVSPTTLSVREGGSATYTVRLGTKPQEDVTVEATRDQRSDDDLTVSSDTDTDTDMDTDSVTLTFTNSNWSTKQTVTVSAAEDADKVDGVAIFSHTTASNDEDYYDIFINPVTATEYDNDKGEQIFSISYTPSPATYGAPAPSLVGPTGNDGAVTYSASPAKVCTVGANTGVLTIVGAGTCTITATAARTANYKEASVTFEVTVDKGDQTLSGFTYNDSNSATVTYGNDPLELTALTDAVGAVTYSSSDTDVCTFDSSTSKLTIAGGGTCAITATAAATADYNAASVTFDVTVNTADQTLTDFSYDPATITFGDDAPTLTAPTLTVPATGGGTVTYSAAAATVCTVGANTGVLTIAGAGTCTITATAAATADYNAASVTFDVTVQAAVQTLTVDAVTGDNTINISEQAAGFQIAGTVTESGASVTVTIGTEKLSAESSIDGGWSVNVPGNADSIAETSVVLSVTASKTGYTDATVTRTLPVDLTAPTVSYTAPDSLKVDVAIESIDPTTSDTDIVSYAISGGSLPPELSLNGETGVITGATTAANRSTRTTTVTATDSAGNTGTATIVFPAVAKADQTLEGFAYSASQVNFGTTPTVTAPSGARTEVTYAATPATVCTVDSDSGALTIAGGGTCAITASAAATDDGNYNAGTATFSVKVLVEGLTLRVDKIAGDNIINEEEKRDGFTISGDTGTESGVTVAVTIGGTALTSATSDANGNWSVSVPEDASSITEPSVWVLVTATPPNMSPTLTVSRELVVDLRDLTNLQVPMKVTDFRVAVADADTVAEDSYVLSWEDPGDNTIIKYEYRWYPRASWSEWTDIPESDTTSYTVAAAEAGLDLNTAYRFQIRAVNAKGAGLPSEYAANALLLPVSFGAAAYKADEGGAAATVTVTLSWPATKKLTIPIRVIASTAEAGDYMVEVIPDTDDRWHAATGTVTLTFDGSEANNTKTFTITARDETDEKDFDDGTVRLRFGELPGGVIAGTPATATLTIIDDEGNVIRSRFRRLNNEILSKHALTLADVTIAAVTSRQEAGPRCADQATTGSLGGQSSLAEILTSNAQTLNTGSLNLKQLLGTSSFRLRLTEDGSGAGPGCLTLWGQGDYRNLSSSDAQGLEWDGDLVTGQVGADALLQPDLRAGLAVSWSEGDFDYTDRTEGEPFSGDYTSRMMSVHPYLTWWSPAGLDVWATGGYGQGEIEIKDEEAGTHTSDTTLRLASVGASGLLPIGDALIAGGTTTLRVKAQASVAQMKVEGNGSLLEEQTIEAQRLRLALEGSHERPLASGGSLTPSFEVGLRHDGGDGATGTGLELGGGLRYVNPALGLTVEGRGRVLAAYEEDYEGMGRQWADPAGPGA